MYKQLFLTLFQFISHFSFFPSSWTFFFFFGCFFLLTSSHALLSCYRLQMNWMTLTLRLTTLMFAARPACRQRMTSLLVAKLHGYVVHRFWFCIYSPSSTTKGHQIEISQRETHLKNVFSHEKMGCFSVQLNCIFTWLNINFTRLCMFQ